MIANSVRPENLNAPATPKQLWALFCATKKDHRGMGLTREAAANMLSELNASRGPVAAPAEKRDLKAEFLDYFKENVLPGVVADLKEAIGIESLVVEDTNFMKGTGPNGSAKAYKFRGFGCSISYLTYDKRSKLAARIEEMFRAVRFKECEQMVLAEFPKALIDKLAAEGTPIGALYCQDMSVNSRLFWGVVRFAQSKGVKKIDYVTRLD